MSLQVIKPYIHVEDANGNPYVGAQLYVYQPGTTTLASIYTDDGLSIAADNPASSDAAGNFPRLYIAAGTYKLRAQTAAGVLIWQEDNIDTGLSAGTGALPISRGGTGATTAAAARAALDVPSNSQLTSLETTITDLQSAIQNIISSPQGYLTPTSGTVVISGDVSASAAVYYTPDKGDLCPVYDGAQFNPVQFSELTLTLNSNHVSNSIYDVFFTKDGSGNPLLVTGPAWNVITAGSGARGTGAGTTELTRAGGVLVNKYDMSSARNGATTYAITANQGTYIGSIYIDSSAGQVSCYRSYGQSRKWGIWNAYNRRKIILSGGDSTATWVYGTGTIRASNNDATNKCTPFTGLAEEVVGASFWQTVQQTAANTGLIIGVGVNSTTVMSGFAPVTLVTAGGGIASLMASRTSVSPSLGINNLQMLEKGGGAGTSTWVGGNANMLMNVEYMG